VYSGTLLRDHSKLAETVSFSQLSQGLICRILTAAGALDMDNPFDYDPHLAASVALPHDVTFTRLLGMIVHRWRKRFVVFQLAANCDHVVVTKLSEERHFRKR
jgi:hypothetical protein